MYPLQDLCRKYLMWSFLSRSWCQEGLPAKSSHNFVRTDATTVVVNHWHENSSFAQICPDRARDTLHSHDVLLRRERTSCILLTMLGLVRVNVRWLLGVCLLFMMRKGDYRGAVHISHQGFSQQAKTQVAVAQLYNVFTCASSCVVRKPLATVPKWDRAG